MRRIYRFTAWLLALLMLLPMLSLPTVAVDAGTVLYTERFDRFSAVAPGTRLSREDGFSNKIPDTTAVAREGDNTYLRVEFAASRSPEDTVYYLNNSAFELVSENTEGAIRADAASYGLISGNDGNIDKNLQLKTPELSYLVHKKAVFEIDYFLSEGANGSIYSQMLHYSSAQTNGARTAFFNLYNIDAETGELRLPDGSRSDGARLSHGGWSTVSVVLDLESGIADYYLNRMLYAKGVFLGHTDITLFADSWIVAKIHRTRVVGQLASEELAGYFCLDNVRIGTPDEDMFVHVPSENEDGEKLSEVEIFSDGVKIEGRFGSGDYLCFDSVQILPTYFDATPYRGVVISTAGAELRLLHKGGLRYVSDLDMEKYAVLEQLERDGEIASLSVGTMIAPYVRGDVADTLASTRGNVKVAASVGEWYSEARAEEGICSFAGSLIDLGSSYYDDTLIGVGYVAVTLNSGEIAYLYGEYDRDGTSLRALALEATENGSILSNAERALVNGYLEESIAVEDGEVSDVTYVGNRLFFLLRDEIGVSISYTGNEGWRLRAQEEKHLGFEGVGAAQALARYLGEEPQERNDPLSIQRDGAFLELRSSDGSYLTLRAKGDFELCAYNAAGIEVLCISDITCDGDRIKITGTLDTGEAVFGGGQRFDSVNRRGSVMRLLASDAWSNSSSTYMAIPLFSTSRGGGFYVNRYEDAVADLGVAEFDEWSLTLENDRLDCYLFATEEIKDVLAGYTALTGSAEMPAEWASGVMVCRYANDLQTFETDNVVYAYDNAPSGYSVKTIVTNLMEAGMKPSAMILEAWHYGNIFMDSPTSLAARDELQKTVDWLDSHGIRTMLYMVVGGSINPSGMPGCRDEYFVDAYVTENGKTSYTNQLFSITVPNGTGTPTVSSAKGRRYLDITNPAAVEWFYDYIWGQLIDMGVDGVKVDFAEELPDAGVDYNGVSIEYDWYDPSLIERGTEHHAYPIFFTSSFYNRMNELKKQNGETDGFTVLARGGGIGAQRYPFMWAGDQIRAFWKLDDHLMATVTSGLSGMPFMTYDMAGYRYNASGTTYDDPNSLAYESEVYVRALQYTVFTATVQTHGSVRNVYELSEDAQQISRLYLSVRDALSEYVAKCVGESCESGVPAVRHPVLEYQNDPRVYGIDDQFLLGDALMVAPILLEGESERMVYLPEGSWTDLRTGEVIEGGQYVNAVANVAQVPLYLNNDSADADALRSLFDESDAWNEICQWTEN